MPNFLLSIKNTESCPYRSCTNVCDIRFIHKMELDRMGLLESLDSYNSHCVGLGNPGCPARENTCENCEHQNDCTKKIANDKMNYPRYLEFCSAHKRKE